MGRIGPRGAKHNSVNRQPARTYNNVERVTGEPEKRNRPEAEHTKRGGRGTEARPRCGRRRFRVPVPWQAP